MLISNQLYFSSINQFNDPYDCHFTLKDLPSYETFELFWKQFLSDKEKYKTFLDQYKEDPEKCISPILGALKGLLNYYGICCFAESKENFLMWSHYADSHRGVCLGFDYDELTKQFPQFDKVEYENEPFHFDITDVSKSVAKVVLRKSVDWKYEQEIRFLMERNKTVGFNMAALREINFGLKTPNRQMQNIIYLISKLGYPNCSFNKANIAKSNYAVAFEKVDTEELKKAVLKDSENIRYKAEIKLEKK